jgi:hypothetical protein
MGALSPMIAAAWPLQAAVTVVNEQKRYMEGMAQVRTIARMCRDVCIALATATLDHPRLLSSSVVS